MLSPNHAQQLLAQRVAALPPRKLSLGRARGLVLAQEVVARENYPKVSVAAMDGYALRRADGGAPLPVAFTVAAGDWPPPLPQGSCARVFTGAPVPEGADTVVEQELVEHQAGDRVSIPGSVEPSRHIRYGGEVFAPGTVLAQPGQVLSPPRLGLLAAAGTGTVWVHPRPAVALVVTGSEVKRRGRAGVRDSNGPLVTAFCHSLGLPLGFRSTVADQRESLTATLAHALSRAHLVLTTGGVSVGDLDLVPEVVKALGGDVLFHGVAMQPGKPIFAAAFGDRFLLGLPGNPVSVLVGFRIFAWPTARALAGDPTAFAEPWWSLPLARPAENPGLRTQFRPARLHPHNRGLSVEVVPWKGSHDVLAAGQAQALVRLETQTAYPAGTEVPVLPLMPWGF